jgi:hypothetical protein
MNSRHSINPAPYTVELDWLLEISALVTLTKSLPPLQDRSERLAQILSAAVDHLGCTLGALLIPERQLRLVQVSRRVNTQPARDALRHLEAPCLESMRHSKAPLFLNDEGEFRLLLVPVGEHATANS